MKRIETGPQRKSILWVSSLVLDRHLHKTTQIEILRAMSQRGYKVLLVASYSSRKTIDELKELPTVAIPLRYTPFVSTLFYVLCLLAYLPYLILRFEPDFIVVEPNPTAISLIPLFMFPRSRRPKVILDIRSTPVNIVGVGGYLKSTFFSISLRIAKKFFQGITIITSLMKTEVCKRFGVSPKLVGVWTSGVSTTAFNAESYDIIKMRKTLGLEDKFVVFYHGAFEGKRGIAETIKAVDLLRTRCPDLILFLLGNASTSLNDLIRELDIQDMVSFHESVPYSEVSRFVCICDVGIVPLPNRADWRYQCPLNLLEYLSMKKVVIVTDIPANREIIGENKCGIFARSSDPKDISDAIIYAYRSRDSLKEWGKYGRNIVEQRYSWTKVAQEFEAFLLQL